MEFVKVLGVRTYNVRESVNGGSVMKDDLSAKLGSMLNGVDGETIKKFMENGGAEKLNKMFSDDDKKKIASDFMKMDSEQMKKKLQGLDLKKLNLDDILKKIK